MILELEKKNYSQILNLGKLANNKFALNTIGDLDKIYVYQVDEELIGFIHILNLYDTMEILNLAVLPNHRNRGIAGKLIKYLDDNFSFAHILLEVNVNNEVAINFYQKNNFKVIRKINNYYNGVEDALVMERKKNNE